MINPKTTIRDIKNMKEFAGFGNLLFPMPEYSRDSLTLDQMDRLLPYHSHIQTRTTIEVLEALKKEADLGKTIFYPIYSEEEMKRDPKKRNDIPQKRFRPISVSRPPVRCLCSIRELFAAMDSWTARSIRFKNVCSRQAKQERKKRRGGKSS